MALKLQVVTIPNVFGFSRGAFSPVRAELRATAALEGSGARPPGCRSSSEPQRPWEPGWARNSRGCRACGRPPASPSCRPHRVPGLPAA